jgi:putative membrane protein
MERDIVIVGIVFIVVGAILFFMGQAMSNSWMYMMSPGYYNWAPMMNMFGIALLIVGFIVSLVGAVSPEKKNNIQVMKNETSSSIQTKDEALEILRTRYAKGEITKEQFEQMKKDLEK